jgi:hypothetical protein
MIARHPDNGRVKSGEAQWVLIRAYRHHNMYDDAIALLESYPKDFPESGRTARHDSVWDIAYVNREKGGFLRMLRQKKEGNKLYRKAVGLFGNFKKEYPDDSRCVRKEGHDYSSVDGQIRWLRGRLD